MRFLIWSNAHGGWYKRSRHGYTLNISDAAAVDQAEADRIVEQGRREHPAITGAPPHVLPEVAVLHPDHRWDTPPRSTVQAYRHDQAVILGVCGHWWQDDLSAADSMPNAQFDCPDCGRPLSHVLDGALTLFPDCQETTG